MAENENFIRFTFYELRVKNNLSDKDTDEFFKTLYDLFRKQRL